MPYDLYVRKKGNKRWIKQVSSPIGAKARAKYIAKTTFEPRGYDYKIVKVKGKRKRRR